MLELELNDLGRVFERIQSAHQFQFAKFKNTQYHMQLSFALSDYLSSCVIL